MTSMNQAQINRLMSEIANLRKQDAQEAHKEADLVARANRANEATSRSNSLSMIQSKLREVERLTRDLASVRNKRADIAKKVADKTKDLHTYEERQFRDDENARKKAADAQKKLIREREEFERRIANEIRSRPKGLRFTSVMQENHDFFISHASEDKDGFVRELAEELRSRGAKVWYDEFTLKIGDSLRRNIDIGLANSRFGIVVLSSHFFEKEWPNRELDGLVALENQGQTRILPIWHKVSKDEVARYSPTLADKVALNTTLKSAREIAGELMNLIAGRSEA